jgi:hypothetical protein
MMNRKRASKGTVMANFKALSRHSSGETEENQGNLRTLRVPAICHKRYILRQHDRPMYVCLCVRARCSRSVIIFIYTGGSVFKTQQSEDQKEQPN